MNVRTIAPSTASYKKAMAANAVITVPLIAINFMNNRSNPMVLLVVILVTVALCMLGVWLYFKNTRIQFGAGRISRRNLFGAEKTWAMSEVGHIMLVQELIAPMQASTSALVLLDTRGGRVLRANSTAWSNDQVSELMAAVPLQPEVISQAIKAKELRKRYPAGFTWVEAHPWWTAWGAAIGILVIVSVLVFTFMG